MNGGLDVKDERKEKSLLNEKEHDTTGEKRVSVDD